MAGNSCSIGRLKNEDCHKKDLTNSEHIVLFKDLDKITQILMCKRAQIINKEYVQTVCRHHVCKYVDYFAQKQRICCDPFKKHDQNSCSSNLQEINMPFSVSAEKANISLIPGKKLCIKCRIEVNKVCKEVEDESTEQVIIPSTSEETIPHNLRPKNCVELLPTNSQSSENSQSNAPPTVDSSGSEYQPLSQIQQDINNKLSLFKCAMFNSENINQISILEAIDQVVQCLKTDMEKAYQISLPTLSVQFYKDHESIQNLMSLIRD